MMKCFSQFGLEVGVYRIVTQSPKNLWDELEYPLWATPDHPTSVLDVTVTVVSEKELQISESCGKPEDWRLF